MVTLIAYNAKGDDEDSEHENVEAQATKYLYGSEINHSWQTAAVYPDSTDTLTQDADGDWSFATGDTDHTSTAYDRLGRTTSTTDQRGVVHAYTFDTAGRLAADTVTSLGASGIVDGTVRRIGTAYDDVGRVRSVTSYGDTSGTTVLNQVFEQYDGWGNLAEEWQSHDGAVDTATTPSVKYAYDDGAADGVAKYIRLTDVVYPNGRDVSYGYGTAGAVDDIMSRLATISDSSGDLAAYKYLGAGTIACEDYVESQVKLDYSAGNFAAWDRFGRVVDQVWSDYGASPAVVDEYTYAYDRAGNRTNRGNALNSALDEAYSYDGLDRLTEWKVNGTTQQIWSLDGLGNDLSTGTYNPANEETPISLSSGYDAAGNMTTLPNGQTAVYDAWNRMTEVADASGIVQRNAYDGTNRRTEVSTDFTGTMPDNVADDYLAGQQVIQTDLTGGGVAAGGYQNLWSPRYIDAPILRDTLTTDRTGIVTADRLFYLGDANYNVTGLMKYDATSHAWEVVERYSYTPYGTVTVRDAVWVSMLGNVSQFGNTTLYTGRVLEPATGLMYYRARYYSTDLERFVGRDPLTYRPGDYDLYRYTVGNPIGLVDPSGFGPTFWGDPGFTLCPWTGSSPGPGQYAPSPTGPLPKVVPLPINAVPEPPKADWERAWELFLSCRGVRVTGPATDDYNCIAFSVGVCSKFIAPPTPGDVDRFYCEHGYKPLPHLDFSPCAGADKILVFRKCDEITHAEVQCPDGTWQGKYGRQERCIHDSPSDLKCLERWYGIPWKVYTKCWIPPLYVLPPDPRTVVCPKQPPTMPKYRPCPVPPPSDVPCPGLPILKRRAF